LLLDGYRRTDLGADLVRQLRAEKIIRGVVDEETFLSQYTYKAAAQEYLGIMQKEIEAFVSSIRKYNVMIQRQAGGHTFKLLFTMTTCSWQVSTTINSCMNLMPIDLLFA
jgi:hypothetical protein